MPGHFIILGTLMLFGSLMESLNIELVESDGVDYTIFQFDG